MNKKIYQYGKKEDFLSNKTDGDKNMYWWIFSKAFKYEQEKSKDLYDFKYNDIKEFLEKEKLNKSTLNNSLFRIKKYMDWANKKGYKYLKATPFDDVSIKEMEQTISSKVGKKYYTYDQIKMLLGEYKSNGTETYKLPELNNIQDKLMVQLMFIGIKGKKYAELVNLNYKRDIDFNTNTITLYDENSTREVQVPQYVIDFINYSREETEYYRYMNEDSTNTKNDQLIYELQDSPYVFRRVRVGRSGKSDQISPDSINKRIKAIATYIGENLTSSEIENSGKLYFAKVLHEKGYEINKETVKNIIFPRFNRFDVHDQHAYTNARKLKQALKDVYGIDTEKAKS